MWYPTKHGLNSHMGKIHSTTDEKVAKRDRAQERKYTRWSEEELFFLAECEAADVGPKLKRSYRIYQRFENRFKTRNYNAVERQLRSAKFARMYRGKLTDPHEESFPECGAPGGQEGVVDPPMDPQVMTSENQGIQAPTRKELLVQVMIGCLAGEDEETHPLEPRLAELITAYERGKRLRSLLDTFLKSMVKKSADEPRRLNSKGKPVLCNRRLRRAFAYKSFQARWRKNRAKEAKKVLSGNRGTARPDSIPGFLNHWKSTYKKGVLSGKEAKGMRPTGKSYSVNGPITFGELNDCMADMPTNKAPGPDNITVSELKALPRRILLLICNLILASGKPPRCLLQSRTVFIPKKESPSSPKDFRPISLAPVLLRVFNKILAKRVVKAAGFDYRQKAFLPIDGLAENVVLLEGMLRNSRLRNKSTFLSSLDMRNAYGSVQHKSLIQALRMNGACKWLVKYVKALYTGFQTTLVAGENPNVAVERGVLQGDPLSPVLFNMVIDQILRKIPPRVGVRLETKIVNGMAFADDLLLFAATKSGLQWSLDAVSEAARDWGLDFNPDKCSVSALVAYSTNGLRFVKVLEDGVRFTVGGGVIPLTRAGDAWRYLGAYFSEKGIVANPDQIDEWLANLRKCEYLKPQQKLYVLRVHVLPKLIHRLVFSPVCGERWEALDVKVRRFAKQILHLPKSTPNAFFHARVKDGGLGLMCFRNSIPGMILSRFSRFEDCHEVIKLAAAGPSNQRRLKQSLRLIRYTEGAPCLTSNKVAELHKGALYGSVDGRGLKWAPLTSFANAWVGAGTMSLTGRQFVRAIKLRINALPARSRIRRGADFLSRTCRAGCDDTETQFHCIQRCFRSDRQRRKRHDAVEDILVRALRKREYEVTTQNYFSIAADSKKPDIIAIKDGVVNVIDPTVVNDLYDPDIQFDYKALKYQTTPEVQETLMEKYPGHEINYGGVVFTYRGIVSLKSVEFLESLRVPREAIRECVLAVVRGSVACFDRFMASTLGKRRAI